MEFSRILGLDIGSKRTGVARSDLTRLIASPFITVEESNMKRWAEKIGQLVEENEVGEVVVGLPLDHHGEVGKDAENIRRYIAVLRERLTVPVVEWDERFTTVQAERSLIGADVSREDRKKVIDKVAASIILQGYLDRQRYLNQMENPPGDEP